MSRYGPVAYSAATKRAMADAEEQITIIETWLLGHVVQPDPARAMAEVGKMVGLAYGLLFITQQHRQDVDSKRFSTIALHYARRLDALEKQVKGEVAS